MISIMNSDKDEDFLIKNYETVTKNFNILKDGLNSYYKQIIFLRNEINKKDKIIKKQNNILKNNQNIIIKQEKEINILNFKINKTLNNIRLIRKDFSI